jgi:vitamin B12 transporter
MGFSVKQAGRVLSASILVFFAAPLFSQTAGTGNNPAGDEPSEDILLMEDPEGITVVGSPETTQEMKIVTKEEIDRIQAPDLAVLLQETLNLGVTRYGAYGNQTDINLRGFDLERVAILINGVPANSPQSGNFEISQIDLNAIDRIEVIYGGSDSKYNVSGALGGIINIITVRDQPLGLSLNAGVANTSALPGAYYERDGSRGKPHWEDLADAQKISFSTAYGGETFSLTGNLFSNRAANHFLYEDKYLNKTRRKIHNEVWDLGGALSFIRDFPGSSKLILSADGYYGNKNIPRSGYAEINGKQEDFSTRQSVMLDMPRFFRNDLALEASLTHAWQTLAYTPPEGASSLHDEHILTAINRWSWDLRPWFTLRTGGDYRLITLDSTNMGRRGQQDGGIYLTAEMTGAETFLVVPSAKAVFNSNGASPVVPVPKLGFAWFVSEALTLKNNYFRNFKYPDFEELYWPMDGEVGGKADLKPEDGWGADLGAVYRRDGFGLEGTFFTQYTTDSIHWSPEAGGIWRPSNVGAAIYFGLDGKADVDLPLAAAPLGKITLSLSYQFMLSYLLSYGYDFASDKRIPYMPVHGAGLSVDLPWERGSLLISASLAGTRYADTANLSKLDPHLLLNANVNQRISETLIFFGEVRNLLNSRYESFDDYPMPGITLTLGVRMNLEGIGASG